MATTIITQHASLVGQVIADLTYDALQPGQFRVELSSAPHLPQYKPGGFFVFANLPSGHHTGRIVANRFQPLTFSVTVPPPSLVVGVPGDNELFVIVNTIESPTTANSDKKIRFDDVIVRQTIRAGAAVLAENVSATLADTLEVGIAKEALLAQVTGDFTEGSIVRIVRDTSMRLKFDPYATLPWAQARVVGHVGSQDAPALPLAGVEVRLTQVNGSEIVLGDIKGPQDAVGARIATVELDGSRRILGTEKDITTLTNHHGDYNLYLNLGEVLQEVAIEVQATGYQPQSKAVTIHAGQRLTLDFQLTRA